MEYNNRIFDLLDDWRHLPSYQLERRADIFFALFLKDLIEYKVGFSIKDQFIPEFPVRIGAIYPEIDINKSYKIDYLAISSSGKRAVLIELKTEGDSRRDSQDKYLLGAQNIGIPKLLEGLIQIFRATNAKRKYFHLLLSLEQLDQITIPKHLKTIMYSPSLRGLNDVINDVHINSEVEESQIIYIQPEGVGDSILNFHEIAQELEKLNGEIPTRFARSLREWAEIRAGKGYLRYD